MRLSIAFQLVKITSEKYPEPIQFRAWEGRNRLLV